MYQSIPYRSDIDGLRALAVLLVVFYHAFPDALPSGFIGVDIFFVISGFLISNIIFSQLLNKNFSFVDFYSRRIRRIFPALILILVTCFAFGWFTLLADEYKQLGKHIAGGAGFISNFLLWRESGYFDQASHLKPLLHLWSLGIEEQFYLIWPLLIFIAWRLRLNVLTMALLIFSMSFAINIYQVRHLDNIASTFYLPHTRFWELMSGAILAYLNQVQPTKNTAAPLTPNFLQVVNGRLFLPLRYVFSANGIAIIGLALIVIGVILIHKESLFPGYWALLPVFGTVMLIHAGPDAWINSRVLSIRIFVWLGLISFPLYLWHWPILSFIRILKGPDFGTTYRIVAICLSLGLAWLTYVLVERPIRFGGYRRLKTAVLVFLMMIIGYIGFNTYVRDGLTFRLNQIQFRLPPVLQSLGQQTKPHSKTNVALQGSQQITGHENIHTTNIQSATGQNKPQIWLWGDSYAGHLVAGYQARFGNAFEIVRLNTNGCPPILGLELPNRRNCVNANQDVLNRIMNERPFKVVLAANWTDYDWKQVTSTLIALQKANGTQIDLVGPAPQWNDSLYKQLYLHYLKTQDPNIPFRMQFGLNPNFMEIEPQLMALAKANHISYISIVNILCNTNGCITRFGDTAETLASFDGGHFTELASKYVVGQFPKH